MPRPIGGRQASTTASRNDGRADGPWVTRYPVWSMSIGALSVSASAVLLDLARTSPGTASFYRCALALPALLALSAAERRRAGVIPRHRYGLAMSAGALFAGDMLLWTQAIGEVGAGLSTVLVNVQVVMVPLLAWAVDREPVPHRFLCWLPVLLVGVVCTGGLLEQGATVGSDPLRDTVHAVLAAVCYSGFLYLLRRGGRTGQVRQVYTAVVASATVVSLAAGLLWYGFDPAPGWRVLGWLLAVAACSQVVGWLLVATASPRLAGHVGAVLLLLTPGGAVALGAVVLGERPTPLQLAGCGVILAGAYAMSRGDTSGDARGGSRRRR